MSTSSGTSTTEAVLVDGFHSDSRKPTIPSTRMLSVRPTTNWSAVSRWLICAWTDATTAPAIAPRTKPTATDPVAWYPIAAANAPPRIIASTEMFRVPARSATHSPAAAKARTTANRAAAV